MIPYRSSDLPALEARVGEQTAEVGGLLREAGAELASLRPNDRTWSLAGHVAHMAIVNGPYLDSIHSALAAAHAAGKPRSEGPFKHSVISRWFVGQNEPPPKRRLKTFKVMVPDPATTSEQALVDFQAAQQRLLGECRHAVGLDLGRIRFGSPFFRLLRLSAGTALALLVAHNDRHIWLMHEVNRMRSEG